MIPAEFTGGWQRVTIAIGDGAPYEDSIVWWLQAGDRHADLRVPIQPAAQPLSFAGVTVWAAPSLTWLPDLTLTPSEGVDTGVISWDGEDLIETGDGYVERWRRMPGSAGAQHSVERGTTRMVRTGDVALTLVDSRADGGRYDGVAWRREGGVWQPQQCWPFDAQAPDPDQVEAGS